MPTVGRIYDSLERNPTCFEAALRVCDIVDSQGAWFAEKLGNLVPDSIF